MEGIILVVFCIIVLMALFALWEYTMQQMLHGPISSHPIEQHYDQSYNKVSVDLKEWEDFVFGEDE